MIPFLASPAAGLLARVAAPLAVGFLVGGMLAGVGQDWRWKARLGSVEAALARAQADHARDLQAVANEALAVSQRNQVRQESLQRQIAAADTQHAEEAARAQKQLSQLRADLRSGARRLRVTPAACGPTRGDRLPGAPASTGASHAAGGGAELSGATAEDLFTLAGRADEVAARLTLLQEYVRAIRSPEEGRK